MIKKIAGIGIVCAEVAAVSFFVEGYGIFASVVVMLYAYFFGFFGIAMLAIRSDNDKKNMLDTTIEVVCSILFLPIGLIFGWV